MKVQSGTLFALSASFMSLMANSSAMAEPAVDNPATVVAPTDTAPVGTSPQATPVPSSEPAPVPSPKAKPRKSKKQAALDALLDGPTTAPGFAPLPAPSGPPIHTDSTYVFPETADSPPVEMPDLTLDRGNGISLTLENSVHIAIQSATTVLNAQNNVTANGANLLQSYGQFLPNLGSQANYNYSTGTTYFTTAQPTTVTGSGTGAGFSLTADLNIFNGLADFANFKSAILKKDASELTLTRAKQQISLDISQAFLQVVLDNQIVNIARKNLQESQARERLLQEQTRLGVHSLSDLFRQEAETSADESFLLTSENKTRSDQIQFLRRLRADVAKKYHFVEPKLPEEKAEERYLKEGTLIRTALDHRSDLKASNELADAGLWDTKNAWGNYLPKLDLVGNMASGGRLLSNQIVNGASVLPPTQSPLGYQLSTQIEYTIGLNLTWTIFDRFTTHENVVKARVAADNLEIASQDNRNQVEGDVRQAFGSYETALGQLRASKKGLAAAQKAYEVMQGRYDVGAANFVDLVTAQAALVQAESARAQALVDFTLQGRTLEFAIGETPIE